MMPASLSQPYRAAHDSAALLTRSRGLIVVSGRDRGSYLQGLLTNDVAALTAGQGCYAAYLTAQGRMISDLHAYELGDVLLLTLPLQTREGVLAKLDQFIFSEDVQLGDVSDTFVAVDVLGPNASRVIATATGIGPGDLDRLPAHGNLRSAILGQPVIVLRVDDLGVDGFELLVPRDLIPALMAALSGAGGADLDADDVDSLQGEKLSFKGSENGRWQVFLVRHDDGDHARVEGALRITAHGATRRIPFVVDDEESVVSVADIDVASKFRWVRADP